MAKNLDFQPKYEHDHNYDCDHEYDHDHDYDFDYDYESGIIGFAKEVMFRRPIVVEHVPGSKVGLKSILAAGPESSAGEEVKE